MNKKIEADLTKGLFNLMMKAKSQNNSPQTSVLRGGRPRALSMLKTMNKKKTCDMYGQDIAKHKGLLTLN